MTTIKLMTASAAAVSLLLVAVGQRDDPVQQSAVAKDVPTFEYQWLAAAIPVMLLSAALEKAMPPEPTVKVVTTETITPPAADPRAAIAVVPKPQEKHVELDICQKHHMHKISTHGGKSWRCRRM